MSFANRTVSGLILLCLVLAGCIPQLRAQTNYGSVRGLAKDIQGGLISDAAVTMTNVGTKMVRATKTNESGEYDFSQVTPGDYVIEVTLKGFQNVREAVTVQLGRTATIDATLQVGSVSETVEVRSSEPLIDTASANGGQLFTSQQLTELPNLGRNPFVFEKLDNNVTAVGDPRYVRAEDQSGSSAVSIAGAPIGSNSYVVDGIPTSTSSGGVTFIPSPEAVSDAKTQANTYDAEVGRTGGGVGNTSLKSGTTTYHGVLYGETRQTNWSANSWLNKHTPYLVNGLPVAGQPYTPRPDVTTYLYAGAIGGPVPFTSKIKYLKNTFFFLTEEGYRQAQPLTGTGKLTVPTPQEAMGDFSGDGITLYDPMSPFVLGGSGCKATVACRSGVLTGVLNGVPTANVVPANYFNPIGNWIAKNAYPSQTNAASFGSSNSQRADDFKTRSDMYSGKLDHTFASWWSGNASYVHLATQEPSGDFYGNKGNFSSDAKLVRFNDATSIYNVITLNPTTIATVGYGFNRYYSVSFQYGLGFNLASGFGGAGFPSGFLASDQAKFGSKYSFPGFTVTQGTAGSYSSLGGGFTGRSIPSASHNFVLGLEKTIGKQSIKGGYVYRSMHVASDPLGANPAFTFGGNYTSVDGKAASSTGTGNGLADLEMGLVDSASIGQSTGSFNERSNYHALFFQDDFRMTEKLTVNLGLRYELELGLREAHNQLTVGFDPNTAYAGPLGTIMHGGLAYAGINGYPVHTANQSHTKFSPRIGVAYQFRPGMVLQAGFGVFYAPEAVSAFNAGYTQSSSYTAGTGGNIIAPVSVSAIGSGAYLSNPFSAAGSIIQPSGNTLGNLTALGSTISVVDFNRKDPLVEQYSVRIEDQLPWATTLTLGYVGAHAKNFPLAVNINQLSDGTMAQLATNPVDMSVKVTNPYYYPTVSNGTTTYGTGSITSGSTVNSGQLLLPFPQFSTVTLSESAGYSLYNALNVKVQKQAAKGLTLLFTYTWASNWDNLYSGGSALNSTNGPADNYNLKKEYARATNDIPNRYAAAATYALPFGRGQQFFSSMPKLLDYVLGGYHLDAIITRQDGGPIAITQGTNLSNTFGVTGFGGQVRPNLVPGVNPCYGGTPEQKVNQHGFYFNPAAFSGTRAFTYGNTPRSISCKGPGLSDTDLNITKDVAITEGVKIRFMVEALNITNTPEFGISGQSLTTTSTGLTTAPTLKGTPNTTGVLSQNNYNRIIQMGGRIFF